VALVRVALGHTTGWVSRAIETDGEGADWVGLDVGLGGDVDGGLRGAIGFGVGEGVLRGGERWEGGRGRADTEAEVPRTTHIMRSLAV
jgi:hypothetical protein